MPSNPRKLNGVESLRKDSASILGCSVAGESFSTIASTSGVAGIPAVELPWPRPAPRPLPASAAPDADRPSPAVAAAPGSSMS